MREILFRGKDEYGVWRYGLPMVYSEDFTVITSPHAFDKTVIPDTVGQYTGLIDKNDTKIFEGDIVLDKYECEKFGFAGIVIYVPKRSSFEIQNPKHPDYIANLGARIDSVKVIGNIFDNPELLERIG